MEVVLGKIRVMRVFLLLTLVLVIAGCARGPALSPYPPPEPLPVNMKCAISPKKKVYLPFEEVRLELRLTDGSTWESAFGFPYSKVELTSLSTIDGKENHQINWKGISRNGFGTKGHLHGIRWFLTRDWSGIIPQEEGEHRVVFVFSSPEHDWQSLPMDVRMHVPAEEGAQYRRILEKKIDTFFAHTYSARINNTNTTLVSQCPKERLPYEEILAFIEEYPYSAFTRFIVDQARDTRYFLTGLKADYVAEDMEFIDRILAASR